MSDRVSRQHSSEEKVLLGHDEKRSPALAGSKYGRRGIPWFRRFQHEKDNRPGHGRFYQIPSEYRGYEDLGYGYVRRSNGKTQEIIRSVSVTINESGRAVSNTLLDSH